MLVATLALSPLASFGVVKAEAADVEYSVAEYKIEDLIPRLDKVYTELEKDPTGLGYIQAAKAKVYNAEIDFNSYATQITNDPNKVAQMTGLLQDIVNLTLSNKTNLVTNISAFEKYRSNVDPLFGTDVTVDDIQALIGEVEAEYLNRVGALDEENITKENLDTILKESFWSVIEQSDLKLLFALNGAVDYVKTKKVILELATALDPNGEARIAFAKAVKNAEFPDGETGNSAVAAVA